MSLKIKLRNLFGIKPKDGKHWQYAKDGLTKISIDEDDN